MTPVRAAIPLGLAVAFAFAGVAIGPRALDSAALLASQDDPVALADRAVARSLDAAVAAREIEAALAADDADLAASFLALAQERQIAVEPALAEQVAAASSGAATASRSVKHFARGLIAGEADDAASLAGTLAGDLLLIGDIRDIVREGSRLSAGQPVDELILATAAVGALATAATFASGGAAAPVRGGLTVVKAARRTGRLTGEMSAWISRAVRDAVDWTRLRSAFGAGSIAQPAAAIRAARTAVRPDKARALVRLAEDVGKVQARAGTRAALDGLKLARGPRDVAKVSALAAAKGGKTRAILKLAGRSAIMLTVGTFNLAMWIFWAATTALGFVTSLKRMVERATERSCIRRRRRRARAEARQVGAAREAAPDSSALGSLAAAA
jgi:hypothetical protein